MACHRDTLEVDRRTRAAIDTLEPPQREALQRIIDSAASAQRRRLEQAVEDMLTILPASLRARLRKTMFD